MLLAEGTGTVRVDDNGNLYHFKTCRSMGGLGKGWVFSWWWDEIDGAPDAGRQYQGEARTFDELWAQIREAEAEREEEINA